MAVLLIIKLLEQRKKDTQIASSLAVEAAILAYIAFSNISPKPFVWAETADEILASVARILSSDLWSGH